MYHLLRNKLCGQKTEELVEFIHSEVKADMEMVKTNPDVMANVFLTRKEKIDLITRLDSTKSDPIDRMAFINVDQQKK